MSKVDKSNSFCLNLIICYTRNDRVVCLNRTCVRLLNTHDYSQHAFRPDSTNQSMLSIKIKAIHLHCNVFDETSTKSDTLAFY